MKSSGAVGPRERATFEDVLKLIKDYIKENEVAFIEWGKLVKEARRSLIRERTEEELWALMKPKVKEIGERREVADELGEARIGRVWIYYPLKMIDEYVRSK